ncbi:hypothetical protein [Clostridium amazonitimonense]|uniref:hypothetical protein n=1 Tax=Clostridium amazonitimonense TaxID=1499689 RepID=UPI0006894D9F|nr:hypothetical protein [Clostridium amazonitimonense]
MNIDENKEKSTKRMQFPLDFDPFEGFNIDRKTEIREENTEEFHISSELMQWPIKLNIISPWASAFKKDGLLIAADCTAYAYGNFHKDFIKGKTTLIACPKSEHKEVYESKIKEILSINHINAITLVRMEVPCCMDMKEIIVKAINRVGRYISFEEIVISTDGKIITK